ncbi:MAG: F0F1 ATP synthase subunit B, partial [Saprospiraceae bacterium]|nr:F0F1 ATP synthase subunit B [Saprospiraceae bacterium]
LFWFLIGKFAFKPIALALKKREDDIKNSLAEAERARDEMANLKAENEQILAEARAERAKILKEATETKNAIVSEAKNKAKEEANRIVTSAKLEIENEKQAALISVKNEVGMMATDIAEKIIRKQLSGNEDHESFVGTLIDEIKLN